MRRRSRLRAAALVAKRLLGAVVLGVATILLVKREPDQHWSDPPSITMVEDHDQAARSGAPPGPARPPSARDRSCRSATAWTLGSWTLG
jgi:hypothetical protein